MPINFLQKIVTSPSLTMKVFSLELAINKSCVITDSIPDFKKTDDDDASSVTSEKSEPPKPEVRIEGFKPTPLQRAFQPGSTPEHLTSRFMVCFLECVFLQSLIVLIASYCVTFCLHINCWYFIFVYN